MNAPSTNMPAMSWLMRHRRRLAQIGLGHLLYAGWNFFFDQVLYVYVIWRLGLVLGGAIMTGLAGLACLLTLLLYQRMKIDWVGAGSLAALEKVDSPAWWQRIILWASRKGGAVVFVALCIFQDAFITTAYFKRGHFGRLSGRDWAIFAGSLLGSNLYWTLRSGAVATVLVTVWHGLNPATH